jgi:hypothetical protein
MANSKGRRRIRRDLQAVGLGWLLKPPSPTTIPLWKKISSRGYLTLGLVAAMLAILTVSPSWTLSEGQQTNTADSFSTVFNVTYEGYWPVFNPTLDCDAEYRFKPSRSPARGLKIHGSPQLPPMIIGHGRTFTTPCNWATVGMDASVQHPLVRSTIDFSLRYAIWPLPWKWGHKTFHLISAGTQNDQHWERY